VSINVRRLEEGTLNITCNILYCNHQVHRDFLILLYIYRERERERESFPIFPMVSLCVPFIKISEYVNVTEFIRAFLFYLLLLWSCLAYASNNFTKYVIFFEKIYTYFILFFHYCSQHVDTLIIIIIRSQMFTDGF
jgi:hypothetical protein